jgi:hypothetical protein
VPDPVTVQITATPYAPEESDDSPAEYLVRCGEALVAAYGYSYTILVQPGDPPVRQLQVNVTDGDMAGGTRAVVVTAPDVVMDVGGQVMTQAAFNAKYGGN